MPSKTTLALLLIASSASAQTTAQNLGKYWSLRARLTTDFLVKGSGPGESVPAQERSEAQGYLKFADATIVLGWYLGVLATEWEILSQPSAFPGASQGDAMRAQAALDELYLALRALERLDEVADSAFPPPCTQLNALNGFFIRDDVPSNMHTRVGGMLTSTQSDFVDPTLTNKEMSQDQVYHLLIGLALVKHLIPANVTVQGRGLRAWAIQLAGRIGTHMSASGWTIKNPACGNRNVNRGEAASGFSGGTKLALAFCTDGAVMPATSGIFDTAWSLLKSPAAPVYSNVNNLHMAMAVAAVGNGWGATTASDLTTLGRPQDWVAYPLLHRVLYAGGATGYCSVASEVSTKARTMLDELPAGAEPVNPMPGPPAVHGWTTNHRFFRPKSQHYVGSGAEGLRFSGLDYLLLHNLYALADPSTWSGTSCGSPCSGGTCPGGTGGGSGGTAGGSGTAGGATAGGSPAAGGSGAAGGSAGGVPTAGGTGGTAGGAAGGSNPATAGGSGIATAGGSDTGGEHEAVSGCGCTSAGASWLLLAALLLRRRARNR